MPELIAHLPPELWVCILEEAVKAVGPYSGCKAFFPPLDDFTLISGFKDACSAFKSLAQETERVLKGKSITVSNSREILYLKHEDLVRIKYVLGLLPLRLAVKRDMTFDHFQMLISRCPNLVSLYILFVDPVFGLIRTPTFLASQNLVQLDLVHDSIWWNAPTLDFPNLRKLRLSSRDPFERCDTPVCVPVDKTTAERFAADLVHTVGKLRNLRVLSVHICLDIDLSVYVTRLLHVGHVRQFQEAPKSFRTCEHCIEYDSQYAPGNAELVRSREATLTTMLAEQLPVLERVSWMDSWNDNFYDEEGMRESMIVRTGCGKVLVEIQGEIVHPFDPFSFDG